MNAPLSASHPTPALPEGRRATGAGKASGLFIFGVLLDKDLRRAWRNPLPWIINLAIPLVITALIGLAFGGRSDSGALGRIRFAVVDEDDSLLTRFLRGTAHQGQGSRTLEPVFMDRAAALRELENNKLAAVVIIPREFTSGYLTGSHPVSLELIKNPAQSIHPAVLEELLGAGVTALNAIARNFQSEFPEWREVIEGRADYKKVSQLIERAGDKIAAARDYLNPPLVTYTKEANVNGLVGSAAAEAKTAGNNSKPSASFNMFAYVLSGMCAMFLLFSAGNAMSDLHRESAQHTFARYHTLRHSLVPFVTGKVLFTVVLLVVSAAVMLGGGALAFGIRWRDPLALVVLVLAYAGFAAGFIAVLTAMVAGGRTGEVLGNLAAMVLGLAGGCAFPPQQLPGFLGQYVSPMLPTYWFTETVRGMEVGAVTVSWLTASLKLSGVALLLMGIAAILFRRRFREGLCN